MYFSFIEVEHKRRPRESWVLANPKITRSAWYINDVRQPDSLWIEGEKIIREPRPQAWRIVLNQSFRQNGKVKKIQGYILTVSWWDVVDEYLLFRKSYSDDEIKSGWLMSFDGEWFNEKVLKKFPDADVNEIWGLFEKKAAPIEESIISEFKKMNEYHWFKVKLKLEAEISQEKKRRRAAEERQRHENNFWEQFKQEKQSYKDSFSYKESANHLSLTSDEARIINDCYRDMALKLHPDKGGDTRDMQILNGLRDRLREGLKL